MFLFIYCFFCSEIPIPNILNIEEIKNIFKKEECDNLNWFSAADTFPKFVQLLQFASYTYHVMLGLVCSVGGLTETLVKNSSSSLFGFMKEQEREKGVDEIKRLCQVVYDIFKDHEKIDRVTVSMFRFLDKLFSSGAVNCLIEDSTCDFAKSILKLVLKEMTGCKDLYKLIDGINVLAQFVQVMRNYLVIFMLNFLISD